MSDELITTSPVDDPHITVDRHEDDLTIHIEGKRKFRLPAAVVTGLIIWGAAAFICPGVLLVTLLMIPLALIALGVIHCTRPRLLKRTLETETVAICKDEILFSHDSRKTYDDGESRDIALPLKNLDTVELRTPDKDDDTPPKLLFIDDDGEHHAVGMSLPAPPEDTDEDDPRVDELQWLADIVDDHVASLREVELDFASLPEQDDEHDEEEDEILRTPHSPIDGN